MAFKSYFENKKSQVQIEQTRQGGYNQFYLNQIKQIRKEKHWNSN